MSRVVLVGDSVFDNAAYVTGPDVRTQVEQNLPSGWAVSLLAVDGSFTEDVPSQLHRLPEDANLVVVSSGGNDALSQIDILGNPVGSVAEALLLLHGVVGQFRADYVQMLEAVLAGGFRSYVCTIYRPSYPDGELQRIASTALGLFNDVIVEEAARRQLPILDIRKIFTDSSHYSNPIEPSVEGGQKLADVICGLALNDGSEIRRGSLIV